MKTLKQMELLAVAVITLSGFFGCQKDLLSDPQVQTIPTKTDTTKTVVTPPVKTDTSKTTTPPAGDPVYVGDYYVAPDGNDNNPGTYLKPFKSIEKAYSLAGPGKLFYFRGGVYKPLNPALDIPYYLAKGINGTSSAIIKFWAYPGETPVIDLSDLSHTSETVWGIQFTGDYWHWKGFEIKGFPSLTWQWVHQCFVALDCNNCTFENLVIHDNYSMGFGLAKNSNNNLILNCDAYNNQDPETTTDPYGNADGFHFTYLYKGTTNTIQGCRSWYNSDDGYDCFGSDGTIIFKSCWSFNNGYQIGTSSKAGDGDGFKLGGTQGSYTDILRILDNCIAVKNNLVGFDQNDGVFATSLTNCINYYSTDHGIYLNKYNEANILTNCISMHAGTGYNALLTSQSSVTNCSWQTNTITDADFVSTDSNQLLTARQTDGSLPDIQFLKLTTTSAYKW